MNDHSNRISRRNFITDSGTTAGGLAAGFTASSLLNPKTARSANDDIVVALVGCGGMGRANLRDFIRVPSVKIAAVCDVDDNRLQNALSDVEQARKATDSPLENIHTTKDFRNILERKDIDSVIVGTPDHWHAYVATAACASGKDVYCEKPVSHNIEEGKAMIRATRNHKRVMQIGTQQRSGTHFQSAVEQVRTGALGKVHVCRTWITSNVSPDGLGTPEDSSVPAGVDYDMWLGPAPKRPFNKNRFHYQFRWFFDYGNGLCNDWGVHLNDLILWATGHDAPKSVQAAGGRYVLQDNTDTPDTLEIMYDYGDFVHIYSIRRSCQGGGFHGKGHGMQFEGTDGILTLDRGGWTIAPEGSKEDPRTEAHRSGSSDQHFPHVVNFLDCVKSREKPVSDIEIAHRATVTCHLGNIAYKVGRTIHWDNSAEICVHSDGTPDTRANMHLFREPRKPWKLEA